MVPSQPNPIGSGLIPNNLPLEAMEQCSPTLQLCTWCLFSLTQLVLTSYPTISHLKSRNNVHLRFNCVHGVLSAQPNWSWLYTQQFPTWSHETMFTYASTVYMYFCNLLTELNVPHLVATSLLNHFEDFVKTPMSFNTSVTDPFSVPTDSHL